MNKQYLSLAAVFVVGLAAGYGVFSWRANSTLYASKCVSPQETLCASPEAKLLAMCKEELATLKGDPIIMGHETKSMEHEMMGMTDALKGKTSDALDLAFLQQMIVHHQGAVKMAEILITETKRPELRKMSADIIRVQNEEIAQMESWLTTWFK